MAFAVAILAGKQWPEPDSSEDKIRQKACIYHLKKLRVPTFYIMEKMAAAQNLKKIFQKDILKGRHIDRYCL
jgi:hypothetical protein